MSQREAAVNVLKSCTDGNEHCPRLAAYAKGDRDIRTLSYEDVFYPLRCHHSKPLFMVFDIDDTPVRIRWGSGDLIYPHWVYPEDESMDTSIDPFRIWNAVKDGIATIETIYCNPPGALNDA